jgi:uncharacterized heparinase superfamily protein
VNAERLLALAHKATLYSRTLSRLTTRQLLFLPLRRVQQMLPARTHSPISVELSAWAPLERTVASFGPARSDFLDRATEVLNGEFHLVGVRQHLPRVDWSRRYVSHLWTFNLHYFEYGVDLAWAFRSSGDERYMQRFVELTLGWIDATRSGRGDGWAPYTVSLRTINWTYALLLLGDQLPADVLGRITRSIHAQLCWLERRLEWHLLANHLQKNFQAMTVGALLFRGADARRWLRRFPSALWRELEVQVLPDGGHFERSPMYHMIAFADYLETVQLAKAAGLPIPGAVPQRLAAMGRATSVLCRPSGELHLFNDSAEGVAPALTYLRNLEWLGGTRAAPAAAGILSLPKTGYFGFENPDSGDRVLIDCGEPGPSYQPGHGHCDLLSYELDLGGIRVVVDSGVCGYDGDRFREYVRSTRAHNTVVIAGREQQEVWGSFRMARRAAIEDATQGVDSLGTYRFEGAYRPYHSPKTRHRRVLELSSNGLTVEDTIVGPSTLPAETFVHFHPDAQITVRNEVAHVRIGSLKLELRFFGVARFRVLRGEESPLQGWFCGEFGSGVMAPCVVAAAAPATEPSFGYRLTRC